MNENIKMIYIISQKGMKDSTVIKWFWSIFDESVGGIDKEDLQAVEEIARKQMICELAGIEQEEICP